MSMTRKLDLPSPLDIAPRQSGDLVEQPMSPQQARDILSQFGAYGPSSNDPLDWSNYASALYVHGRDEDALKAATYAVSIERNVITLLNLGIVLEAHGRFTEALALFEEANRRDPGSVLAGSAYSDGLVRLGRWDEGWPLYAIYHSRLAISGVIPSLDAVSGKPLLINSNGGAGDAIYHLRWLKILHERHCEITYAGPSDLTVLLEHCPWIDHILAVPDRRPIIEWYCEGPPSHTTKVSHRINLNEFRYCLSNLTLPSIIKPHLDSSIWPGPYISVRRPRIWPSMYFGPRIGICWKAGEGRFPRPHRTLTPAQRERLLAARPLTDWVSLVFDETPLYRISYPKLDNWQDTSKVVDSLDLLVTVDTGVAHLAGAMGKSVWVLLPAASAWPYGLGHDYKAAYPSMRVFRNEGPGIDNALDQAISALEAI